jgi:Arc/MetJ-type ribon-helix-helix transcriptional regulator
MARKNIKRSVSMSSETHDLLVQLAVNREGYVTEADLIREAIRQFLEEQTDVLSSRRHFQQSLQDRLDRLEAMLTFHLNILIYLLVAPLSEEGDQIIEDAIVAAKRDGDALLEQIQAVRDLENE